MANAKRYLITHTENNTSVSPVGQILGAAADNIKLGANFLATDAIPGSDDILEFPNVGVTSAALSESQIKQLKGKKGIIAVEEDTTMHILEEVADTDEAVQKSVFDAQEIEAYQRGYNEAMQSLMDSWNQQSAQNVNPYQQVASGDHGFSLSQPRTGYGNPYQFGGNPYQQMQPFQMIAPIQPIQPIFQPPIFPPFQPTPWNIAMVKAPGAWARNINGNGIRLAIIDTGVANHTDLLPISGGASFVPGIVSFNDDHGHGTHCAGIACARNNFTGVVGVAPRASLFAVKVLNAQGSGQSSWIIAGMDWCAAQGMHVVSMSLGGTQGPSVAYANAVKRLQDRGTVVVIATGNSFGTSFPWVCAPANSILSGVANASPIAVGSIDRNRIIAPSSSRGANAALWNHVTVVAPGVQINSTIIGNSYGIKSGTSMATPHVAGAAALLKQRFPGISPANVKARLRNTATDLGAPGNDTTYGAGLINCDLATL